MINLLSKNSNWKLILPAFLGMVYCLYAFQNATAKMSELAKEEVTMVDMKRNYDVEIIKTFFEKIGKEGMAVHQHATGVVDMIFPIAYGLFFILVTAFFLKKITAPDSKWLLLALLPIVLMIFDYIENFNTLKMLKPIPELTSEMVDSASTITGIKSGLTKVCVGIVFILGMIYLFKIFIKKKSKHELKKLP